MSLKVVLSDDDCHWMVPLWPLKVNTVLLVGAQTVVAPLMLPATDAGLTVMVTAEVVAEAHAPLVTTAL
jgi:hypothetical protein